MPANTTLHSLPYPLGSDPAGQGDVTAKNLAEALDEKLDTRRHSTGMKRVDNIAFYDEASPNLAGYIVIQLNYPMATYMARMDIKGWTYAPINNIIDISLTFYSYPADNTYYSVDVNNNGTMQFAEIKLMTRTSDGKLAIALLPETSSNLWQYPRFVVDAMFGYQEISRAYTEGWTVSRVANLSAYSVKVSADAVAWRPLTFANSWVNYGDVYTVGRYRKIGTTVYVQGLVKNGLATYHIANLPDGYRPSSHLIFPAQNDTTSQGRVDMRSDGNIVHMAGGTAYFSLSNICFPVDK